MSTNRDRFYSLASQTRKKTLFGSFRLVLVVIVATVLVFIFAVPQFDVGGVMTSAFSKKNQGVILDYFEMSDERIVHLLGEPQRIIPFETDDALLYWNFDQVTLELHLHNGEVARIAYATSKDIIREHVEERALKIYGDADRWAQERRNIQGETQLVYENKKSQRTVAKQDDSVVIYDYLFSDN